MTGARSHESGHLLLRIFGRSASLFEIFLVLGLVLFSGRLLLVLTASLLLSLLLLVIGIVSIVFFVVVVLILLAALVVGSAGRFSTCSLLFVGPLARLT